MIRYKRYARLSWWMLMVLILSLWSWQIVTGRMPSIDQWSLTWIERVEQTQLYIFARFITNFGSDFFLVPFTLLMAIGLIFLNRDWLQAFIFSGGTLMTY